jgi:hypothetical protein
MDFSDNSQTIEPPVIGMSPIDNTPPETVSMPVYDWREIQSLCSTLTPDMIQGYGVIKSVNCRLRGQPTRGPNSVPAENRLVRHDIDYCVYRLQTILANLNSKEIKVLFNLCLNQLNQLNN